MLSKYITVLENVNKHQWNVTVYLNLFMVLNSINRLSENTFRVSDMRTALQIILAYLSRSHLLRLLIYINFNMQP